LYLGITRRLKSIDRARLRSLMAAAVMMVAGGQAGLLELLSGGKRAAGGGALERIGELGQLVGLGRVSTIRRVGGGLLQLAGKLRDDCLELLWTLRLQLLQLIQKLRSGRKAGHISLLLDGGS